MPVRIAPGHPLRRNRKQDTRLDTIAGLAVIAAIYLNFGLAILNANLFGMSTSIVTVAQLAVTAIAFVAAFLRFQTFQPEFYLALGVVLLCGFMEALIHGEVNAKAFYDVLVIPIFILLGASVRRVPMRLLVAGFIGVFAIALVDAFATDAYISLADPGSYFRATREWVANQGAKAEETDLYVGAVRGGGSWFAFFTDHRVGSVFLEPLSLGYFALIASLAASVAYNKDRRSYLIAVGLCLVLSLLSDSRMATVLILVFAMIVVTASRLPFTRMHIALAPFAVLAMASAFYAAGFAELLFSDMFDRLAITFETIAEASFGSLLLGDVAIDRAGDSGVLYLVYHFGPVGAVAAVVLSTGVFVSRWRTYPFVGFAFAIYAAVSLLFGGAYFSIKTAALLGFVLGAAARARPFDAPRPSAGPQHRGAASKRHLALRQAAPS